MLLLLRVFEKLIKNAITSILILSFSFIKLDMNQLRNRMDEVKKTHIADIASEQAASAETLAKMRSIYTVNLN